MKAKLILAAVCFAALAATAAPANAEVPIESYGMLPSSTQAGGHPDLQVAFTLKNAGAQQVDPGLNTPCDCENARFITVHAPPGLVGNPHATPKCTSAQFSGNFCPVDSQVGVVIVAVGARGTGGGEINFASPVYNMVPRAGEAGLLAFEAVGVPIFEVFSARTGGDYGLDTKISVWAGIPVWFTNQVLWGVPAAEVHDRMRFPFGGRSRTAAQFCDPSEVLVTPNILAPLAPLSGAASVDRFCGPGFPTVSSNSPETPFLQAPTTCGIPLRSSIDVLAYDGGETDREAPYPATTGCDQLTFDPSLAARPTTRSADSPAGIDVELTVPQTQSPTVPSPSEIRNSRMLLPEGFTVNSAAADGKSACTDQQARFGTEEAAQCPETAKIGTLEIETPLLPGPLPGYLYLGQPLPGERYRVVLVADGFNVHVKLPGTIEIDRSTGRVAVVFKDLPQTPFERFTLHVFGAERGSLATPTRCGTYAIETEFGPWDGELPAQQSKTFFPIEAGPGGAPCPGAVRPFGPSFAAASSANSPGAHATFSVQVSRPDGDQFLRELTVKPPPGFSANLNGIPYCSDVAIAALGNPLYAGLSELASSACPAASRIGTVSAGAGAGSKPFFASGKVYLAGPYKGAPLSLVVVIPAVSGPYDLGNVAVRAAIEVDPTTARVATVSDSIPQIIEGIPLRGRSIQVDIDRPGFALTPTNCNPHAVEAAIGGAEGGTVTRSSHYQVANCAKLPFEPRLSLRLRGGTARGDNPALRATVRLKPGSANFAGTVVAMPRAEFLDQAHIRTICTRVQFAADRCPAAAIYGRARAFTPILDRPLEGPVYLRSSNHELPDLVADLRGQVDFEAVGRVDSVNGGIRTTFSGLPDVPVSKFVLNMQGGRKGLLENSRDICAAPAAAKASFQAQNGKRVRARIPLVASCGNEKRTERRGEGRRGK